MREPSKLQKQAISHLKGPAMVIAGPGSGKTFTIIQRILNLVQNHHIPPDNILVITYTKAAANEMKERYEKAISQSFLCNNESARWGNVNFGTFHSICYNILKQCGRANASSLIKEVDKRKLLQIILGNNGLASKCNYDIISKLQNHISRIKNLGNMPASSNKSFPENTNGLSALFSVEELFLIQKEYDQYLREQGMIDFDDMITESLSLLSSNQAILCRYQNIFQYILADEFQDINYPQYEILKLLALPSNNLFVVGDDDQAIYGFRGATPGIMKRFLTDYTEGTQILLTENYRCGTEIVCLAQQVISQNKERFVKEFYPIRAGGKLKSSCFDNRKEEEAELINHLLGLDMECLIDTAVIVRTNMEVIQYKELLKSSGIAVRGSKKNEEDIFSGFMIEDISAFLAFLYEGRKRSDFLHFMNKPNRFFTRMALTGEKVSLQQMEQYYRQNPQMLSKVQLFFRHIKIASGLHPHLAVSFFRKTLGYDNYLHEKAQDYKDYQRLLAKADQIQCFMKAFKGNSVREFIDCQAEKTGQNPLKEVEEHGAAVCTMHGAKGLEFGRVFLPDVNEGIIPGKECVTPSALEEERRLLYVAITRAREELYIYYTKERGRKLSRYLQGIIPPP